MGASYRKGCSYQIFPILAHGLDVPFASGCVGTEKEGEEAHSLLSLYSHTGLGQFKRKKRGIEGESILTFLFSLLAGLQTDPEAGKHYGTEEGEPVVGETHQAGEAPAVFGP